MADGLIATLRSALFDPGRRKPARPGRDDPPADAHAVSMEEIAGVCTQAVRVLVGNGHTSQPSIDAIAGMAGRFGCEAVVMPRWGEATVRLQGRDAAVVEFIAMAPPVVVDMRKVAAALAVIDAVTAHRLAAGPALTRLQAIAQEPPVSALRFVTMSTAGAAALGVIFGAPSPLILAMIAVVAGLGAVLRRFLGRISANPYLQPLGGALLAGLAGALGLRAGLGQGATLIGFCPCMVLLPGPHLLGGALDLAQLRLPLGVMRVLHALLVILVICMGLLVGLLFGDVTLQPFVAPEGPVPLVWDVASAGVAVAAFGGFFALPWRMLPVPVAIGMAAHSLHWMLMVWGGVQQVVAAFIAALFVGAAMTLVANRSRLPFGGCAFAAVVSMIPGLYIFRMAGGLVTLVGLGAKTPIAILSGVVADSATAMFVIIAIGFGLIVPALCLERSL